MKIHPVLTWILQNNKSCMIFFSFEAKNNLKFNFEWKFCKHYFLGPTPYLNIVKNHLFSKEKTMFLGNKIILTKSRILCVQ